MQHTGLECILGDIGRNAAFCEPPPKTRSDNETRVFPVKSTAYRRCFSAKRFIKDRAGGTIAIVFLPRNRASLDFHVRVAAHVRPINSGRERKQIPAKPFVACRGSLRDQIYRFLLGPCRPIALDHFDTVVRKKHDPSRDRPRSNPWSWGFTVPLIWISARSTLLRFRIAVVLQSDHLVRGVSGLGTTNSIQSPVFE